MQEKFFNSFRFKNVLYSLVSMVLAMLTVLFFLFVVYFIYVAVVPKHETSPEEDVSTNFHLNNSMASNVTRSEEVYFAPNIGATSSREHTNQGFLAVVIFLAICIGFTSFTFYFSLFTKKMSAYLCEIAGGIEELSTGNFEVRVPLRNEDELTRIAQNVNKMAREIKLIMEGERSTENKKNELITNVAHDLRTPLTSIIGYLELVKQKELPNEVKEKYIDIAYNKSKRLEKLIEDLFSYMKFEFGEVKLVWISVDLVKMMQQLLDEFYPSFQDNKLEYEFKTQQASVFILADGNLMARAFANLIGNAIKYGADGKNIHLELQVEDGKVIFLLQNFGEIIPKEELGFIFDKFYRVESSRSEDYGGTGLGLSIVKSIIELHRGSISVKSDSSGTIFEVILPIGGENQTD